MVVLREVNWKNLGVIVLLSRASLEDKKWDKFGIVIDLQVYLFYEPHLKLIHEVDNTLFYLFVLFC